MAHTPEFRREAVRLYRVGQRGISPTAAQLGIAPGTLRAWVRQAEADEGGVYLVGRWGTGATTRQISVERIRAGGANWVSRWPATATGANQPMAIAVNGVNAYVAGIYSYSEASADQLLMAYVY